MHTTTRTFRPRRIGVGGVAPPRYERQPTACAHRDQPPTLCSLPLTPTATDHNHTRRGRLGAKTPPPVTGVHHLAAKLPQTCLRRPPRPIDDHKQPHQCITTSQAPDFHRGRSQSHERPHPPPWRPRHEGAASHQGQWRI
jgi:hypothetical protein